MANKLIIFSGPSGAGKTSIAEYLLEHNSQLEFSVSACSRSKRADEVDGIHYYFLSPEEFRNKIKNSEFLEWEEVYKDNFYGTLKSEVQRIWSGNKHVIFDVDVIGGLNIKKAYRNSALAIFILPPSVEELKKRLVNRSTETEESLRKRIDKADKEIEFAKFFDKVVINKDLEKVKKEVEQIIFDFIKT